MLQIAHWLASRRGIAHRQEALRAGYRVTEVRSLVATGGARSIRRTWLASPTADADLVAAAEAGGRLACVSVARRRGWWQHAPTDTGLHLSFSPNGRADGRAAFGGVAHWNRPIAPADPFLLEESLEDALAHVAGCLPPEQALAVWETAIRTEKLSPDALREIRWSTRAAAACAESVTGLADSGLESIFVYRLGPWGIPFRQQVVLAGRPVDVLIGERLVIQVDGYAYHFSSADRTRDVAHDAELRLRGYTVLRFTYAQIMHDWPAVARVISRAIAAGAHLAR
jgi:very-short-patch-repair endonuclease